MSRLTYGEQLKHPNWQRRRLERLQSAGWRCAECGDADSELHVHHERYIHGRMAWEYDDELLTVLCESCHSEHHGKAAVRRRRPIEVEKGTANLLDRALWLLLSELANWPRLSDEDRELLLNQQAPYGPMFECFVRAADGEYGTDLDRFCDALGAASMQSGVLSRIRSFHDPDPRTDLLVELRLISAWIRLQHVDEELKTLFDSAAQSPDAQLRSRELMAARKQIKAQLVGRS